MAKKLKNQAAGPSPKNSKDKSPEQPKETLMEFISSMAVVLVTGLFIVTFNFQAFEIPSTSMKNTLLVGDHLFVDRVTYAPKASWVGPLMPYREVKRGDVVVFLSVIQPGLHLVKRIVGVPGDHLHLRNGVVFRNGEKIYEPTVIRSGNGGAYIPYRDDFPSISPEYSHGVTPEWAASLASHMQDGDLVVPPDSYFAMGDNRDASFDGRFWGFVPKENLIGRPMFIYWSFNTPEDQVNKSSPADRVSWIFHVVLHFFDETQWKRTLRLIR